LQKFARDTVLTRGVTPRYFKMEKELSREELEGGLKEVITTILGNSEEEDRNSPIFQSLLKNIQYLNDAEDFDCMVVYPVRKVINTFVREKYPTNYLAQDIYMNYSFFENNLSELCKQFYGFGCCVDKARTLLRFAIKWKQENKMPEFNWEQEYTYQYPKTGTMEQWMNFIIALSHLLRGDYEEYLLAFTSLIETHNNTKGEKNEKSNKEKNK